MDLRGPAHGLAAEIAVDALVRAVDVADRALGVGDVDGVRRLLGSLRQPIALGLEHLPGRHVAGDDLDAPVGEPAPGDLDRELGAIGADGEVWRVGPTGTTSIVAHVHEAVEGPDVAPMSFGPYGGNVFVGSDGNHLLAMSPTGNATMIGTWFSPGRVHFVPDRLGTLDGTELSYFTAVYPDGVVAYPHSDFDTLAGCALVASDTGSGVAAVSWTGTQYVVVPWCTASYHHERSDFVDFDQPRAVPFDIDPRDCPNWLNTNGGGILQAAILGTSDFNVNTIDPGTVRLAGVAPLRSRFTDCSTPFEPYLGKDNCTADCTAQGRDNYLDLLFQFDKRAVVRALGQVYDRQCMVLRMTGNTYDGRPLAGEDVVIILKRH